MRLLQVMDGHECLGLTPRPHQHWAPHEAGGVSDGLHGDACQALGLPGRKSKPDCVDFNRSSLTALAAASPSSHLCHMPAGYTVRQLHD